MSLLIVLSRAIGRYALGTVQLSLSSFLRTIVVDYRKYTRQYPKCKFELYILVRYRANQAAIIQRTWLIIPSGPRTFIGGIKAMVQSTSLLVISGNKIYSWYSILWISQRSSSSGMGKKVTLRSRALSSGSLYLVFIIKSFNIRVVVGITSPCFLTYYTSFYKLSGLFIALLIQFRYP